MKKRYKLAIATLVVGIGFYGVDTKSAHAAVLNLNSSGFGGFDSGVGPGQSRPNSDATAALFDRISGALGTINKIDFENLILTDSTSLTVAPGVTATWFNQYGNTIQTGGNLNPGYNATPGVSNFAQVLPNNSNLPAGITFSFVNPIQAFAGYFTEVGGGSVSFNRSINFTDGTSQSSSFFLSSPAGVQFLGFTALGTFISSVTVQENPGSNLSLDAFGIDDIRYVNSSQPVPEPMTINGSLAAVGIGWLMKRKPANLQQLKSK